MSGQLQHSPADIVRYMLIDMGHGTLPTDGGSWPIHVGQLPDGPDNCIKAMGTTPVHQGRTMNDGEVQERLGIQIMLRSVTYPVGYAKIRQIDVALNEDVYQRTVVIGARTYLVHAVKRVSGPLELGKETPESKRELFTLNITVSVTQAS